MFLYAIFVVKIKRLDLMLALQRNTIIHLTRSEAINVSEWTTIYTQAWMIIWFYYIKYYYSLSTNMPLTLEKSPWW